jgi:hypothetical protein
MAVTPGAPVLALLRAAAMTGASVLEPALAADVDLDASRADEPRLLLHGRDAVLAELERWWSGEATLIDWHEQLGPEGALVELERLEERGLVTRLRLCLRWREATVQRIWAWEARPRPEAAASPEPAPEAVRAALAPGLAVRRVRPGSGWLARVTDDRGREALLPWERLPAGVVRVVAEPADGWWVVRRELGTGGGVDAAALGQVAAAVHAAFADGQPVAVAARLEDRLTLHAPATAAAERGGRDLVPKQLAAGWECFARVAGPDLAATVLGVLEQPGPLVERLEAIGPATLVHGDLRMERAGLVDAGAARAGGGERRADGSDTGPRELVLDGWGLATWAPAALEAAWAEDAALVDALSGPERDLALLARLADRGWRIGLAAVAHPDPALRGRARDELERHAPGARRALG